MAGPCDWRMFGSVAEFASEAKKVPDRFGGSDKKKIWAGGSRADAIKYAKCGDVAAVPEAEEKINGINDALDVAGAREEWMPDVCGAFANVPEFLAGSPLSMWRREPVHDERGEINVYVNTAASCSVSAKNMRRRGVCVLAAVMALSRMRSVRLFVYSSCAGLSVGVRCAYPLDVSEVCGIVTQPCITRRLFYDFAEESGRFNGEWANWAGVIAGDDKERAEVLRAFGDDGSGVVITPHKLGDLAGLSNDDFIARINGMLAAVASGGPVDL